MQIRQYDEQDMDAVIRLSLRAWAPVFASIEQAMDPDVYRELHPNWRISFALSWRGKYDDIIHGYAEVSPLEPEEWALITPVWWASLIESACQNMRNGIRDDGWIIRKLLQRSALMGPDAAEFR